MRILILQRFDLASVSCARRVLCQTEELLRRGHEVTLSDFPHAERRQEIPTCANLTNLGGSILPLDRRIGHFNSNLKQLKSLPRPGLIHLWKAYPDASLLALWMSRYWKTPLHYDYDDWEKGIAAELTGSPLAGWIAGRWDRLLPRLSHTVSTASAFLKQKALEWGAPPDRIWDAPVGAELSRFFPRPKDMDLFARLSLQEPVLVYSGQLEVASYAEQTLETLLLVRQEIPTTTLLVLGGGRKLKTIEQFAQNTGLADWVVFTDYVPADEIPRYLALADVALAPFEANDVTRAKSPLKIAEYLAMGLPIVASDIGETRTMTRDAGACVPCGDCQAMADQTLRILRTPAERERMRRAGRRLAETLYNWKTHVDGLENAYQTAIGQ